MNDKTNRVSTSADYICGVQIYILLYIYILLFYLYALWFGSGDVRPLSNCLSWLLDDLIIGSLRVEHRSEPRLSFLFFCLYAFVDARGMKAMHMMQW